jgi:hypothetical protein
MWEKNTTRAVNDKQEAYKNYLMPTKRKIKQCNVMGGSIYDRSLLLTSIATTTAKFN